MDLKRRGMIALLAAGSMAGGAVGATVISAAFAYLSAHIYTLQGGMCF